MTVLYLGVTANVLNVLACEKLGDTGNYFLIAKPTIECYTGAHLSLLVAAIPSRLPLKLLSRCLHPFSW